MGKKTDNNTEYKLNWNQSCTHLDTWIPNGHRVTLSPDMRMSLDYDYHGIQNDKGEVVDFEQIDGTVDSYVRNILNDKDITEIEVAKRWLENKKNEEVKYSKARLRDKISKKFSKKEELKKEDKEDSKKE